MSYNNPSCTNKEFRYIKLPFYIIEDILLRIINHHIILSYSHKLEDVCVIYLLIIHFILFKPRMGSTSFYLFIMKYEICMYFTNLMKFALYL